MQKRFSANIMLILSVLLILESLSILFYEEGFADDKLQVPLTIRVGAYENRPKIFSNNNGKVVGLFPDILEYIAKKEGWELKYVHGTWSQCLDRLAENKIDLMVDVAFSNEREKKYSFTNETFLVNWATVYSGSTNTITSLIDLNGKKIAVMKGSIHTDGNGGIKKLAEKFDINCSFVEVDNYREVFQLVSDKEVDAGIVNRIFGALFSGEFHVKKTAIIFNPRHLKFAFPKNSPLAPGLIETLDKGLYELKKDPDSIYNKAIYIYLSGLPRELIYSEPEIIHNDNKIMLTGKEEIWIRNHPEIKLGVDPEFAPFEYFTQDGTYQGIASEYIEILNERLGLNMSVVKGLSWKEAVSKAKTGELDVLPCVGITQERKQYLMFSRPYINFHRAIITRTDIPFLTGLEDIETMTVAVQQNSSHEGYLLENTQIKPVLYPTLQEAMLSVSNGQSEAFVGNIASSTYWIRKLNLTNLKVAAPVSQETQNLHFAVRNDWPELVSILNKGLVSINRQLENNIRKRWINIEYEPGIARHLVWRYLMQTVGVALIIVFVIILWNYRLKREIHKRIEIDKKLFEANKSLKKLDQLKSMFIASMSHELRTPLNSIIGFSGIILQGMTGPLNEKQEDHLSRVYNSAKHLLALITDVIDISKIEAGRIDIYSEDIILTDVINEAFNNIEPQLKAKNLIFKKDIPDDLNMHTDKKRLLQCIINYLSNAVKFTESGEISILAEQHENTIQILVKDTGIGISDRDMEKLFEAFERLDSHLRVKAGGTGLGLYLTKKLATDILGGDIMVQSELGKGSTFGLILPVTIESEVKKPEEPEERHL